MSRRLLRSAPVAGALVALLTGSALAAAPDGTPDDPAWADQWGPVQIGADAAWATATGEGAVIAIVDSGVDLDHEDLRAQLVPGASFIECETSCGDGDWESVEGAGHPHGTHVAGIAAAATDNGIGIAGVAPDAKLMPVKVLDAEGSGGFGDIANGIRWAADNGADVINLSLGALPGVQALELTGIISDATEAIAYARSKGAVVVVAAGNESFPLCATPAFNDGALCVASTDRLEARSWFSNGPLKPDLLALSAPGGQGLFFCGEDILSTVPAGESGSHDVCGYPSDAYDEYAGTSMAAPHVAGVAALLSSMGCTDDETLELLTSTARDPLTGMRGVYEPTYGYGIVDAAAATTAAADTCTPRPTEGGGTPGGDGKSTKPKGKGAKGAKA